MRNRIRSFLLILSLILMIASPALAGYSIYGWLDFESSTNRTRIMTAALGQVGYMQFNQATGRTDVYLDPDKTIPAGLLTDINSLILSQGYLIYYNSGHLVGLPPTTAGYVFGMGAGSIPGYIWHPSSPPPIGIDTPNTGAFTTLQVKTSPWVDVRAYGAVGNGSVDDAAAIQAALNAAAGGTVVMPYTGLAYLVGTMLDIPANTTIMGLGGFRSVEIKASAVIQAIFRIAGTGALSKNGCQIKNLYVDGDGKAQYGIEISYGYDFNLIENCWVKNATDIGIYVHNNSWQSKIDKCRVESNGIGIKLDTNSNAFTISNSEIESNTNEGIYIVTSWGPRITNCTIQINGNTADKDGVYISGGGSIYIGASYFEQNGAGNKSDVYLTGTVNGASLIGNYYTGGTTFGKYAVNVNDASHVNIIGGGSRLHVTAAVRLEATALYTDIKGLKFLDTALVSGSGLWTAIEGTSASYTEIVGSEAVASQATLTSNRGLGAYGPELVFKTVNGVTGGTTYNIVAYLKGRKTNAVEDDMKGQLEFYAHNGTTPTLYKTITYDGTDNTIGAENLMGGATTGGYLRKMAEATGTPAGTTTTFAITLNIPTGVKLQGCQLRVDAALTAGETWSAALSGGATTTLAAVGQAVAKDTKVNMMLVPAITTNTTNVTITRDAGNFTNGAGVIRAICYYDTFSAMANAP